MTRAATSAPETLEPPARQTPDYRSTFVFDNDFAALLPDATAGPRTADKLLVAQRERGICRVVCFAPRHDLTLGGMDVPAIRQVVDTWTDQYVELGAIAWVRHVQIFENRGTMMGASNPHPHGQIWANESVPNEPAKELTRQTNVRRRARLLPALRLPRGRAGCR